MKEEDMIREIEEQTAGLPVPDSVSPKEMKKMLDARRTEQDAGVPLMKTDGGKQGKRKGWIVAACLALCFVGSFGVSRLFSDSSVQEQSSDLIPSTKFTEDGREQESSTVEASDEEEPGGTDADGEEDNALVHPTTMTSPASYEEYYQTLKSAYDAYYDRISLVYNEGLATNGIQTDVDDDEMVDSVEEAEAAAEDLEVPMLADSVNQSSRGAVAEEAKSADKEGFSTTNTQEKSVDEGDIIKTDGTWIYRIIQAYNNRTGRNTYRLTITKAKDGSLTPETTLNLEKVPKTAEDDRINFYRMECYLYGDRLILVYDCETDREDQTDAQTWFVTYDLKDRANPVVEHKLCQSGWYETSRISNGYLYIISNFDGNRLDDEKEYRNYIPYLNGKPVECEDIYYPRKLLLEQTHVLTSIDLKHPDQYADSKAVPSTGNQYYVSEEAIYLYATDYGKTVRTRILRVAYEKGRLTVGSSAVVAGCLYDTFALNEYNGYLRIVATIPASNFSFFRLTDDVLDVEDELAGETAEDQIDVPDTVREDVNALYILDRNMELTGKLTGLAPGETIYSARFFGDTGYFVTYRNMDPLFSVDLSDPENPKVTGSLKIAGFSNYLHFYDRNLLLGIGQETDPKTQEFLGLKVSMFDISDPSDVKEEDKYIIEHSDYSDALYQHKAIMIDPEKNLFGFCYMRTYGRNYNYMMEYVTFTYDKEKGFIETAAYPMEDEEIYDCTRVRGLYIGDYFYLVTDREISSYRIGSEEIVDTLFF